MDASIPFVSQPCHPLELDKTTDDNGRTPQTATLPTRQKKAERDEWFRQLGMSHRRRNELASHDERTCQNRDLEQHTTLRRHWPGIVAAMRTLSHCYNEGAGLEVLSMADDASADSRTMVVEVIARDGPTLTITLVDAELCVRQSPSPAGSLDGGQRWIAIGESDEATAAYALQHWLTQL